MDNVSLKIWQVMQPMVRKEITKQIQACMKCKVMTVTTAYNSQTQTVGVREPFSNEVFLPVYGGVDATKLVKGAVAWVVAMHGSWSNAMVFMLGDGSGTAGLSVDDKTEIEQAATQAVLQALPEWVRSEEKPTYTAQEVGAVPITGGRMTGSLNLGATDSQNSVLLTQHRLGTDGQTKWQLQLLIDDGNTGNVAFFQNGQLANRIRFFTDKTTLGQPLDIGSGGFGGTTAAEARANLGITPQNIGAVPLAGGTMTGNLTVGNGTEGNSPMLLLRRLMSDGTTNGNARLYMTASGNLKIDLFRDDTRVNSWTLAPDTVTEIPTKLPSPGTLTFTGAATGTYDGSQNVTIDTNDIVQTAINKVINMLVPYTIEFDQAEFYGTSSTAVFSPISTDSNSISFNYRGGSGVEELLFPITGLSKGRTYTIDFSETYNGGFISDSYKYGCGIIQKSQYDATSFPTGTAKPSWITWDTGSSGTQSGNITFTAQADTVYWAWSMGRLSDNVTSTIIMIARVY